MKRNVALLSFLVFLVLGVAATALAGDPAPYRRPARIEAATWDERARLVRLGIAIAGVGDGFVWASLTDEEAETLRREGFQMAWETQPLDFPPNYSDYHNYAETLADLADLAADYPHITRWVTLSPATWEGRLIQGLKITDRPDEDEGEPGALFFALTHAREHLTTEMALYIAHHFTERYGQDPAVTNLVNHRVLWVFPNVNPDGGEYDIHDDARLQGWRKNRRANPGGSFGVDLNRNYGYMWGCCGWSSPNPTSDIYRGPAPFSEPETQAIRDFVLAHPELTVSLSLHTYGEWIFWPWGYTQSPVPDPVDHATFQSIGRAMAATNGYRPAQANNPDFYPTEGISDDWLYGERGIIAFTVELYPRGDPPGFYPDDSVIPAQTARNRAAVEILAAMAQDPRRAGGGPGDIISPTVTLTTTTRYWPLSSTLTLEAQATDNESVTLVWLEERGNLHPDLWAEPPYTWNLPTGDEPGIREFTARAYDAAHNLGLSAPLSVAVGHPHGTIAPSVVRAVLQVGEVATRTVVLQNAGYGPLTWGSASPTPGWCTLEPVAGELAPGASQVLTTTLSALALAPGTYASTLTLGWNDPFGPEGSIEVFLRVAGEPAGPRWFLPVILHSQ
ncbi:MAG: M14 family zinc carboxypeptidase [Anaerolineae bacterium]